MSGVCINMEMPTSCGYCPLRHEARDGDECYLGASLTEYQKRPDDCPLIPCEDGIKDVVVNIFDEEEVYTDCTVQVLRNSLTGDVSVGWWRNNMGDSE